MNDDPQQASQPGVWECFAVAIQFLTRVPVSSLPGSRLPDKSPEEYARLLQRSVVYFPVVGGLVGLFTAVVLVTSLAVGLSPMIAAFLALGAEAVLTGAFHEDAFADTWDAMGGGWTRERILEIMKDSRLGTYGTLALVLGVGIRASAMSVIGAQGYVLSIVSIVAAASLARLAILAMMATTDPIADRVTQVRDIAGQQSIPNLLLAALLSLPFWVAWAWSGFGIALISMIGVGLVLVWFRGMLLRRVGGTTGDLLGCSAYLTQLVILIGATLR